jgi:hypothetical protein
MEETNFVLDGMTNPCKIIPTTAMSDKDSCLIQANSVITQEQQVVSKLLQLFVIHTPRLVFILEVLVINMDEWCRGPETAPPD